MALLAAFNLRTPTIDHHLIVQVADELGLTRKDTEEVSRD
jgi:hypothetical protein